MLKKNIPVAKAIYYQLPKKVFIKISSRKEVLKVWPVPYKYDVDWKKLKDLK